MSTRHLLLSYVAFSRRRHRQLTLALVEVTIGQTVAVRHQLRDVIIPATLDTRLALHRYDCIVIVVVKVILPGVQNYVTTTVHYNSPIVNKVRVNN